MITISVTQEDIDQGCKSDSNYCPVARALMRELGVWRVSAGGIGLGVVVDGAWKWYETPTPVTEFMSRFDAGLVVEPFSFDTMPA